MTEYMYIDSHHVEHTVRLVHDHIRDALQGNEFPRVHAEDVNEAPRRADDDVGPGLELRDLLLDAAAAVAARPAQAKCFEENLCIAEDLRKKMYKEGE